MAPTHPWDRQQPFFSPCIPKHLFPSHHQTRQEKKKMQDPTKDLTAVVALLRLQAGKEI
jgi:hypothetical protein